MPRQERRVAGAKSLAEPRLRTQSRRYQGGESLDFQIWADRFQSLCFSSYSRWTRFFSEACFLSRALAAFIA